MSRGGGLALNARQGGFTLLELMVVVTITAMLCAGVAMALPSGDERALHRDAERLAAWLEVARAQSRSRGTLLVAQVEAGQARIEGALTESAAALVWQSPVVYAQPVRVVLGPEPLIAPQQVMLRAPGVPPVLVTTAGVQPFAVVQAP